MEIESTRAEVPLTQQQAQSLLAAEPAYRERDLALQQLLTRREPIALSDGSLTLRVNDGGSLVAEFPASARSQAQARLSSVGVQMQSALRQSEMTQDLSTEAALAENDSVAGGQPLVVQQSELDALRTQAGSRLGRAPGGVSAATAEDGTYRGVIVAESEHFIAQQEGNDLLLHRKDRFAAPPEVGSSATIQYNGGAARAQTERERAPFAGPGGTLQAEPRERLERQRDRGGIER